MKSKYLITGTVVTAIFFSLMIGQTIKPESQAEPYIGTLGGENEVQRMNSEKPERLLQMARKKLAEGYLREAALVNTSYLMSHPTQEGFELYVEIFFSKADKHRKEGDFVGSIRALAECRAALEHWKSYIVGESMNEEAVKRVFILEDQVMKHSGEIAGEVMEIAETKRDSVRRWWWRDNRESIIDALVLLDSINPEILPREVRVRHSRLWTEYYGLLGNREIEKYKVRSNLENY